MAQRYTQTVTSGKTRFSQAPIGDLEFSTMHVPFSHLTTFNGGDIVPIACMEVLPHDTFKVDLDFIIRQATVVTPTMGQLFADIYAFFVPNRVVNKSWVNVMGENSSGAWKQDEQITLAPLCGKGFLSNTVRINVGSVADYYGFPTQGEIPVELLQRCHDLKFRGYLEIYNNYFRDQNYQPPIPYSKLNVYNGFFGDVGNFVSLDGDFNYVVPTGTAGDGQFPYGSVIKETFGEGYEKGAWTSSTKTRIQGRKTIWNANSAPLKANKMHDYFTSVLPSPQKADSVAIPVQGRVTVGLSANVENFADFGGTNLKLRTALSIGDTNVFHPLGIRHRSGEDIRQGTVGFGTEIQGDGGAQTVTGSNIVAQLDSVGIPLEDIRLAAATQQYFEVLGRGGSRYLEVVKSLFGIEADNPYADIPTYLGHFRRELDLFQTAQTSASPSSSQLGTPQGNLTAFGYTNKGGQLFTRTFLEHGYVHIFAVVRHRNVYATMLSQDNFRMNALDYYSFPFANISNQPVYGYELDPFMEDPEAPIGYQEAWATYRYEPDRVSGWFRPQANDDGEEVYNQSLAYWTYTDPVYKGFKVVNGLWLESNTADVVARTTAVQDKQMPQFKGQFIFNVTKERAMPTYSVPGLDIL